MGRNRISTATQEAKGAFRKDPQRKSLRSDLGPDGKYKPLCTSPIGAAPKYFKGRRLAAWDEFIGEIPEGVLNGSHRKILELACDLVQKQRAGKISGTERGQLIQILSRLGMTPVDQSKIVARQEKQNEFAEFSAASTRPN